MCRRRSFRRCRLCVLQYSASDLATEEGRIDLQHRIAKGGAGSVRSARAR